MRLIPNVRNGSHIPNVRNGVIMDIYLYTTGSERHAIRKELTNEIQMIGSLRDSSKVVKPTILVELENPSQYNYMYIPDFGRYYFITEIESVRTNLWNITGTVDVLMSFQEEILNLNVIISDDTSPDDETYYMGEQWKTLVKTKTDVISFPSGLLETGEYILITSGGVAS